MVWHVEGVDTYSFTTSWQASTSVDCSGYANYVGIFEPDGGSYLPVQFIACWN
ncbi:MAG: hypothetical protein H6671_16465 [Anaerolineaceae bacterium]|nr:hypothetical protein [Anaerolineaceae bacterium]